MILVLAMRRARSRQNLWKYKVTQKLAIHGNALRSQAKLQFQNPEAMARRRLQASGQPGLPREALSHTNGSKGISECDPQMLSNIFDVQLPAFTGLDLEYQLRLLLDKLWAERQREGGERGERGSRGEAPSGQVNDVEELLLTFSSEPWAPHVEQ